MKLAIATLESVTPYSQSRHYNVAKVRRELPKAYEERTWRERCHVTKDGNIFIPPMAFAASLKEAARYLTIPIPGQGKSTFTKNFEAGIMVAEGLTLPVKKDEVQGEWLFVPSNGQPGGARRVEKCFPLIPKWSGEVGYYIVDDIITEDVFSRVLDCSGSLIGIGRFRPRNRGYYGRFKVKALTWTDQ